MIKSVEKAIKILELLSSDNKSHYTLSELANISKIHKSAIFRILQTLKKSGYVDQEIKSKEYKLLKKKQQYLSKEIRHLEKKLNKMLSGGKGSSFI